MGLPFLDLLVALFFLLSLVVVAKFRNEIRIHDTESYRFLSGGLAILAVVALIRIYSGAGLFATIPFLSDPLFFKVISWIGIITGATFLVSGISTWLPIARVNRQKGYELVQRLELIKKVEQLVMVETRQPEVLCTALDYMVELNGLTWGAVYSCPEDTSTATLLSTAGTDIPDVAALRQIECTEEDFFGSYQMESSDTLNISQKLSSLMPSPNLVLPLVSGDHVYGAFLLWNSPEGVSNESEMRVNLKIAVDTIARQLDLDSHRTEVVLTGGSRRFLRSMEKAVDSNLELRENFVTLARLMVSHFHADHVSFAMPSVDGLMRRLTVGIGGTLLDEIGLDLRAENSHVGHVLEYGEPMIIADLEKSSPIPTSDLIVASGIHSIMTMPVSQYGNRKAVLSIGSREINVFDERYKQALQAVMPIFSDLIIADANSRTLKETERCFSVVEDFLREVGVMENLQAAFQCAADLILSELDCSMVRIATFNHDGVFLRSRAFAHEKIVSPTTPQDGHMVLSLMPLHRQIRDQGQVLLIGTDQNQTIEVAEASQAFFGEVQRAMLIPITVGRQVLAVISVANAHRSDVGRNHRIDMLLTKSIAGALSLAIRAELNRSSKRTKDEKDQIKVSIPTSQLRGQVNSSLSGILGSLEMIKAQQKPNDPDIDKYLSIIDKSAQRIHEYVTQPEPE